MDHTPILITGGQVVDPYCRINETADIYIEEGLFARLPESLPKNCRIIKAKGKVVTPGFIDMHTHFRQPGNEAAEDFESGSLAAAAGGFVQVLLMPNTSPPIDSPELLSKQYKSSKNKVDVLCAACMTKGRKGLEPADIEALDSAGAIAFTDDGSNLSNEDILINVMARAAKIKKTVLDHALDPILAGNGVIRSGKKAESANLPGIPESAEAVAIERDIRASEKTGCKVHIQHISTKIGIEILRNAKSKGLPVSAEATPHHIFFIDEDIDCSNSNFKMSPPLGNKEDREAIIRGMADGTIEAFATDHAPHTVSAKSVGFMNAPFGVIGLETAVGATYTKLVKQGIIDISQWVSAWTVGPARILGLPIPSTVIGTRARVSIFDLKKEFFVDENKFRSRSKNTPFSGIKLTGVPEATILDGQITWFSEDLR